MVGQSRGGCIEMSFMSEQEYWEEHWTTRRKKAANNFAKRAYTLIQQRGLKTLLDVGSGDGRDSLYFAGKGLSVTAVDFSESGIDQLKSQNDDIQTRVADIKNLKFSPNSFDVIYAHLSLHYFDDRVTTEVFESLYQMLKKGGLLFVKCKSVDDALYGKGKKIGPDMYQRSHLRHFFSREYMQEKLKSFKICHKLLNYKNL